MDKLLRFSDYDVFAYISAGLAALLLSDVLFSTHWIVDAQWTVASGTAVVFGCYVVGHVIAWPASFLIERQFVVRVLGPPSKVLFEEATHHTILTRLFPDYFAPLNRAIVQRVKSKARSDSSDAIGQNLFWAAFAVVKRDPATYARLEAFLKLYGFCRNIAFVAFLGALALFFSTARTAIVGAPRMETQFFWAIAALLVGVSMFYRFLKFYRLYSVEVFVGYAEIAFAEGGKGRAR